jgi:hypothetical protein
MDVLPSTVLLRKATSGPSRSSWTGGQTSTPGKGLADTANYVTNHQNIRVAFLNSTAVVQQILVVKVFF